MAKERGTQELISLSPLLKDLWWLLGKESSPKTLWWKLIQLRLFSGGATTGDGSNQNVPPVRSSRSRTGRTKAWDGNT